VKICALLLALASVAASQPIQIHPENPKYFLFRGKPLMLVTATEHYGSVINRPFDFEKYLNDAADKKITLTRAFLLFRELQGARNPSSPCKPESPDYIAPFMRTGPGNAMDGEPIYDLDRWNPEFFDRLHRFLQMASDRSIVVELTLLSNTYGDNIWALNPLRDKNNKQGIGSVEWQDYTSLKNAALVERQTAYVRKIIQETSEFDNVYYEICNEPGGGFAGHASPADVDAWQEHIARVVREELLRFNRKHLVAGQEAFTYGAPNRFPQDKGFSSVLFDIVNVHPLPETLFAGRNYQLGNFMSKELHLSEIAAFCRATYSQKKPSVLDEDNAASLYRDPIGWTIHRKRAWTAAMNGTHYDYIDFSITIGSEAGTRASSVGIRSWMKHLSEFMTSFDFIHAEPQPAWISRQPGNLVISALAVKGKDYAAYLADPREASDATYGDPIQGQIAFELPPGRFAVKLYSPVEGTYAPPVMMEGGKTVTLNLAPFQHDIVVRATKIN
jgi:hypothetical protein